MSEKRYRNKQPILNRAGLIETGTVWHRKGFAYVNDSVDTILTEDFVQDTRFFEPVKEWPKNGDEHIYLAMDGVIETDTCFGRASEDRRLLAIGNVFDPETKLNPHGVNIDDVRKLFLLSLKSKYFAQMCLSTLRHQEPIQFQASAWDPERELLAEIDGETRES